MRFLSRFSSRLVLEPCSLEWHSSSWFSSRLVLEPPDVRAAWNVVRLRYLRWRSLLLADFVRFFLVVLQPPGSGTARLMCSMVGIHLRRRSFSDFLWRLSSQLVLDPRDLCAAWLLGSRAARRLCGMECRASSVSHCCRVSCDFLSWLSTRRVLDPADVCAAWSLFVFAGGVCCCRTSSDFFCWLSSRLVIDPADLCAAWLVNLVYFRMVCLCRPGRLVRSMFSVRLR